jgi:CDP-diacylglycerol---glycerol-3-phosphate 3-phosphatidyltransferase
MNIYRIKPRFQQFLQPLVRALVVRQVHPDWLTGGAVVVAGVMAFALIVAPIVGVSVLWWVVVGAFLRLTLNALDGQVARARGMDGAWGEVKNELGDRLADALIFAAIAQIPGVPTPVALSALVVALLTGMVGILAKATIGTRLYNGPMGKPDRMMALAFTATLVAITGYWQFFISHCLIITVMGTITIWKRLEVIHEQC